MAVVLLVEDQDDLARVYKMGLEQAGHLVSTAHNVEVALASIRTQVPDVLLLDMLMPGMSGMDLLRQLNPKQTMPNTKIIVLSNTESPKVQEEAKRLGALKYCLKVDFTPKQLSELLATI